jgi:hypothetical protein
MTTREIKVFSTLTRRKIESSATTWGELQTELRSEKVRFDNMKVAIGKSKLMLEHPEAELPTSPFTLYLMPMKTKSGYDVEDIENFSYDELRDIVRDLFLKDSDVAHKHFNTGDHYTNKKKDNLKELVIDWFSNDYEEEEVSSVIPVETNNIQDAVSINYLQHIVEQLEQFHTDKEHIANAVYQSLELLRQVSGDWSTEEEEYKNLVQGMYQEEYEDENEEYYEEDNELGL